MPPAQLLAIAVGVRRTPPTPPLSILVSLNGLTGSGVLPLLLRVITKVPVPPLVTRTGLADFATDSGERTVMGSWALAAGLRPWSLENEEVSKRLFWLVSS